MSRIWKYELMLDNGDVCHVEIPQGARILSAGIQGETFVVWALVDPEQSKVPHRFAVHGTGHPISDEVAPARYLNVVLTGPLVFHVFDLGEVL